jgi:hypothetical protein
LFLWEGPLGSSRRATAPPIGGKQRVNTTGHFILIFVEIKADRRMTMTENAENGMLKRIVWN